MIASFRSKPLSDLWETGKSPRIDAQKHRRILRILDALEVATRPEDMNVPSWKFHPLHGFDPTRYAVSVNGPWRITFAMVNGEAQAVDFEQYH